MMQARTLVMTLTAVGLFGVIAPPSAEAAKSPSPAMTACSGQWDTMKKENKLPKDETWSKFWSQCSKDVAAKNGADTAPKADTAAKPAKSETPAKPEAAAAPKEPKKESKKTAAADVDDTPGSTQQKRDCDAKWDQHKVSTGAHGWHDYFKFMSGCI
jgi:hypothetical protein